MPIFDDPYVRMRRRMHDAPPGLVRMDRALLYLQQRLRSTLDLVETRKTKTLGEGYYRVQAVAREIMSICQMGGDHLLSDLVAGSLGPLSSRTPRTEAIATIRALIDRIAVYEPLDSGTLELSDRLLAVEGVATAAQTREAMESQLADERSVFVIMPFSTEFADVWKGGIQRAAEAERFTPIRVDQINRSTNITDDIVASIEKCRLAIVDVTGNNPNVMFELGYAIARSKKNIIISQSADYLPFDIRNIRTIVYANTWSGIEELKVRIQEFLKEAAPPRQPKKGHSSKAGA
jgi:hypothetical protein